MNKIIKINEIRNFLPHRYPFLLVDRVLEHEAGKSIIGLKNVTANEEFFNGHFPQQPVMPGVLMIEALAQISGILYFITNDVVIDDNNFFFLAGVDNARFKRIVGPGDQLMLHSEITKNRREICRFTTKATVNGEIACVAELLIAKGALKDDK